MIVETGALVKDDDGYDAADNSRGCYELAIATLRERLESFRCERIGPHRLYLGQCEELFPLIGRVDIVITDPPYGSVTHAGARSANSLDKTTIDFACIDKDGFAVLCAKLVEVATRWVVMTCEWRHAATLEDAGLPLVRLGVWVKPNGAPQFTGDRPGTGWEAIAILHRPGRKRWNGGGRHGVWHCPIEQGEHPTQKPLKLVADWVQAFSDPGDVVLDPFMGSGTTGVACVKLGRKFIGIERDERYFDLACKRLDAAHNQPDLFVDPGPKPKQLNLLMEG